MKATRQPALPPDKAFFHLIYEHRYLAVAGYAWDRFGPDGSREAQDAINEQVPGIGALVQDSLLLHARALIEFFLPGNPHDTDIVHNDFGLPPLGPKLRSPLEAFRRPIEVHLGHLTAWRDEDYRTTHAMTARGKQRQRPDWNLDNRRLVMLIFDALDEVSRVRGPWSEPFSELHTASRAVLANPAAGWPDSLTEKVDVQAYLRSLGLASRP